MHRLIDANALKKRLIEKRREIEEARRYGWEFASNGINAAIFLTGCEAAKRSIDAIPIDYLRSQVDSGKWEEIITRWEEDALRFVHISRAESDAQPTIDAVPISFIEKKNESIRQYLSEHEGEEFMNGLISKAIAYEKLIEEWREENGQTD